MSSPSFIRFVCLHCEQPVEMPGRYGLCDACGAKKCIVLLYKRPRSAHKERRLRELRRRANLRLPLFPLDHR